MNLLLDMDGACRHDGPYRCFTGNRAGWQASCAASGAIRVTRRVAIGIRPLARHQSSRISPEVWGVRHIFVCATRQGR